MGIVAMPQVPIHGKIVSVYPYYRTGGGPPGAFSPMIPGVVSGPFYGIVWIKAGRIIVPKGNLLCPATIKI
jgi:hypothetical protein